MWWGWGHFLVYGGAVFAVARLGLPAVAAAAVVVHVIIPPNLLPPADHGSLRQAFKTVAKDVLPAAACCVGLAAAALPVSVLASKLGIPVLPYLLMIAVAGGAGYFLSLRLLFPSQLRHLGLLARLIPPRTHRLFAGSPCARSRIQLLSSGSDPKACHCAHVNGLVTPGQDRDGRPGRHRSAGDRAVSLGAGGNPSSTALSQVVGGRPRCLGRNISLPNGPHMAIG